MATQEELNLTPVIQGDEIYNVALSPEHASQIIYKGIYTADPDDFRDYYASGSHYWDTSGKYHCRNWVFDVHVWNDGRVYMTDNYWCSSDNMHYLLTDENFDEIFPKFKLAMDDKNNYHKISDPSIYDPADVQKLAFGSGGWSYGGSYYVRNDAQPVVRRELAKSLRESFNTLHNTCRTYDLDSAIRDLDKHIKAVEDAGLPLDDADERKELNDYLATLNLEDITLGEMANGDFARWLKEDAYCPGEIYGTDGYGFRIFEKDFAGKYLGAHNYTESDGIESLYEFIHIPTQDAVVVVASRDGKATGATYVDATMHNIKLGTEGFDCDDWKFDKFKTWHENGNARNILSKMIYAREAIKEIAAELDSWTCVPDNQMKLELF